MAAKVIKLALLGFMLGMVVGVVIAIAMSFAAGGGSLVLPDSLLAATGSEAGALLAQMLVSGAYGAVPMAGVIFYDLESWGLLKQSVVHYATYTAAFIVVGICVGWIDPTPADIGLMAGIFLVGHCIIWLIMYARYKAETKELNTLINEAEQGA